MTYQRHTVGISDMKTEKGRDSLLVTHSLGSCIGVTAHDPVAFVGGLLHYQLPDSEQSPSRSQENPFMFADTGIPLLMDKVLGLGAHKGRLVVKLFGGSNIMDTNSFFNIGKRNYTAARKMLWKLGYLVSAEDVGGDSWRTIALLLDSGAVIVKSDRSEYAI